MQEWAKINPVFLQSHNQLESNEIGLDLTISAQGNVFTFLHRSTVKDLSSLICLTHIDTNTAAFQSSFPVFGNTVSTSIIRKSNLGVKQKREELQRLGIYSIRTLHYPHMAPFPSHPATCPLLPSNSPHTHAHTLPAL